MNRKLLATLLVGLVMCSIVVEHVEAHGLRLKKLAKAFLVARAFKNKKIYLPLPLPLPIPLFKENVHHEPVPVHHHTKAVIGYGFEQGGHGGFGGGYGGGFGGGHGGGYGGGHGW